MFSISQQVYLAEQLARVWPIEQTPTLPQDQAPVLTTLLEMWTWMTFLAHLVSLGR